MDILFVTATRIGDAVLSTGLLSYLVERYPGARLTIAAGPVAAPLFEAVPGARAARSSWTSGAGRCIGCRSMPAVAARRWDLVVDLRGSALAWLLRAGERKVMAKGDPREHRVRQLGRLFGLDPPPGPRLVDDRRSTNGPPARWLPPAARCWRSARPRTGAASNGAPNALPSWRGG